MSIIELGVAAVFAAIGVGDADPAVGVARPRAPVAAFDGAPDRPGGYSSSRVLVRVREGVSLTFEAGEAGIERTLPLDLGVGASERLAEASRAYGVIDVRPLVDVTALARPALARRVGLDEHWVFELPAGSDVASFAARLGECAGVFEHIGPDRLAVLHAGRDPARGESWPSDPEFGEQWGLHNTGQDLECGDAGTAGADISALGAWALYSGDQEVVIAVMDAGVNEHRDLQGRLVPGRNYAGGPTDETGHGFNNHGTFVAGIAAAIPDNDLGIAGVSWEGRVMPIRVFNDIGLGSASAIVDGIVWAVDNGADIINMSFGFAGDGPFYDVEATHAAVMYANDSGALLVASTGNVSGQGVQYPARYPEVMGVGATNNVDGLWSNSTTGPEVALTAPGVRIVSLVDTPGDPDSLGCDDGTSWAAPFVSGVAALVWSRQPAMSNDSVRALLEATADDLGEPGWDEAFGWGRVNAEAALEALEGGGVPIDQPVCISDLNGDGLVDITDLLLYIQWYDDGLPGADVAPPHGVLDFLDIVTYLLRFVDACSGGASEV